MLLLSLSLLLALPLFVLTTLGRVVVGVATRLGAAVLMVLVVIVALRDGEGALVPYTGGELTRDGSSSLPIP